MFSGLGVSTRAWPDPWVSTCSLVSTHLLTLFSDINRRSIRMDASKMYPDGFHPIQRDVLPHYSRIVRPLSRTEAMPKYYYTNFDVSVFISSDSTAGDQNGSSEAEPPLGLAAFKVDIGAVGTLLEKEVFEASGR